MLFSHLKRLCIIGPSLILALPQPSPSTSSFPTSLPSSLQKTIPECAHTCLEAALDTSFPVSCISQGDLGCLCSHYSTHGSTFGEVALGCLYSSCSSVGDAQASSAFNVCVGQSDAVVPTQSALTVTALETTTSTVTSTSTRSTRRTTQTPSPSSSTLATSMSASTQFMASSVFAESIVPTTSVTLQASAASSNNNSTSSPTSEARTLSTTQIIGISVAGAAVIVLAVGAMVLSICLRRRHERRVDRKQRRLQALEEKNNPDFAPPSRFPMHPLTPPPARLRDPRGGGGVGVGLGVGVGVGLAAAQPSQPIQRVGLPYPYSSPSGTLERSRMVRADVPKLQTSRISISRENVGQPTGPSSEIPLEEIGLAISPETDLHVSPESFVSTRTMSRLLPDKPVSVPAASRKEQRHRSSILRPDSVLTTVTLFEEDTPIERKEKVNFEAILPIPPLKVRNSAQVHTAQSGAREFAQSYVREIEAPQTPTRPHYFMPQQSSQPEIPRYAPKYGREEEYFQAPPLSLNIPVRHSRFQPTHIVSPIQEVTPPQRPRLDQESMKRSSSSSSLDGYIPDYYISPEKLLPRTDKLMASTEIQRRPSKSPKRIKSKSKASSTTVSRSTSVTTSRTKRESSSSNTTFESADLNDPTPDSDDMDKQLSPVAESPISNLRYPKVPRASNQAVPRSPKSPKRPKAAQAEPTRTQSPTPSLLAKRRGEKHAQELQNRLWTPDPYNQSPGRNASSRQGHGRGGSDESMARSAQWAADQQQQQQQQQQHNRQSKSVTDFETQFATTYKSQGAAPEMEAMKSPLWMPKLTPTRQGDDLFISVV